MAKPLIIVESPAKIKTLKKFLGESYNFASSVGHIRDLPEKEFGIDIDHDFEPTYETMKDKQQVVKDLKEAAKKSSMIYLSPDPDREGEAIAWHIREILPKGMTIKRVSFNAITKQAVQDALKEPREIDMSLVHAQQARRILDRLVGYSISPILNRRIQRGKSGTLSAGRVQSVALKLVVMREKEILAFVPKEYWTIEANLQKEDEKPFLAHLHAVDGVKVEKELIDGKEVYLVDNQKRAEDLVKEIEQQSFIVEKIERKEKKRYPVPSFITSTLQQEASRHYGFSSNRTMNIAQTLYEGVDLGADGPEGLITYMRTDSVRVEMEAIKESRNYIKGQIGEEYLPAEPIFYATKKSAQDAHEAIRPTSVYRTPQMVQPFLTVDQFKLYQLIWKRFVASQMLPAIYDTISLDIGAGRFLFRASGSIQKFSGYLVLYQEKEDEENLENDEKKLPNLTEKDILALLNLNREQSFTRPPPRYSEASLVKELEKSGIGRPSTYASIMNKIQNREYTTKEQGRLKPTELGFVISDLLDVNFNEIMKIDFTSKMEDDLEEVAENKKEWRDVVKHFWHHFFPTLEEAKKSFFVPKIQTEIACPKCSEGLLQKVWSRSKYFYGCNRYPDCDFTSPVEEFHFDRQEFNPDFDWNQKCPNCGSEMKVRHGKFGPFLGCTTYPDCKGIINIPKKGEEVVAADELPACPAIGCSGQVVMRRSRFGKPFYSCSTFPECDVIGNSVEQLEEKYPNHPRTAYVKKEKGRKKGAKGSEEKPKKGSKKAVKSTDEKPKKTATKSAAKKAPAEKKKRAVKPVHLSDSIKEFLGVETATRQEVLKEVWRYIKESDLQDKKNKRRIVPDAKLGKLLGENEPFDMMQIAKLLSQHFQKNQ